MSIVFEGVSKRFGKKVILNKINFEVRRGEILVILGKSGVGKSVSLKQIIGLLKPDEGQIRVDGVRVEKASDSELSRIRKDCGMVFQHPALLDSLTIFENIAFGIRGTIGLDEKKLQERVQEKLQLVHLQPDILPLMPPQISYGMQKRVSLARTLVMEPSYLLFDEPTTGLDPITTTAVNQLIQDLSRKLQVTSVVVSHDMKGALEIADRILVLDRGRILIHGTKEEIIASEEPLIRAFLAETDERSETPTRILPSPRRTSLMEASSS